MREEQLADLLGGVIAPIQITEEIAESIARALRTTEQDAECRRVKALTQADQRRRVVVSKLDRGYEDFLEGRISEAFWTRKSQEWEAELQTLDRERAGLQQASTVSTVKAAKIFRTRETGRISLSNAVSGRTTTFARYCPIELHLRSWNSLSHLQ